MPATYEETSPQTPTFFVLFPGVDPTPWVEDLGKELGISESEGTFCNSSMGQGQEKPAEAIVERYAKNGGWVMLQNCHLMSSWVPSLRTLRVERWPAPCIVYSVEAKKEESLTYQI